MAVTARDMQNIDNEACDLLPASNRVSFATNMGAESQVSRLYSPAGPERPVRNSMTETVSEPNMDRFGSVTRRMSLLRTPSVQDPAEFFSNIRLTPLNTDKGIWQVLSSAPGLGETTFKWVYTMVNHGKLSYTWSLLRVSNDFNRTSPVMRPISILQTAGENISLQQLGIIDLSNVHDAKTIIGEHFYDSWHLNGHHIGFQVDEDFRYEWRPHEIMPGTGEFQLLLWRINVHDNVEALAATIHAQPLIQHPMDHKKECWCVDVDVNRVSPHIALLSAMAIKAGHPKFHAWFAKKKVQLLPPALFLNFAFQDEGRVYHASGKFWGDWEEQRIANRMDNQSAISRIQIIRVFNKEYLKQFALSSRLLELLEKEASARAKYLRQVYNLSN